VISLVYDCVDWTGIQLKRPNLYCGCLLPVVFTPSVLSLESLRSLLAYLSLFQLIMKSLTDRHTVLLWGVYLSVCVTPVLNGA